MSIVDSISSPDFAFPLKKEELLATELPVCLYKQFNLCNLFEFIGEMLHLEIPLTINGSKFGPGEIIVNKGNQQEAEQELGSCVKELQKLIHAKKHTL